MGLIDAVRIQGSIRITSLLEKRHDAEVRWCRLDSVGKPDARDTFMPKQHDKVQ